MKKRIALIIVGCIILIAIPFAFDRAYSFIADTKPGLMKFSGETWFGFTASYLGAIGTFLMSFVALYQNKKYKELSDKAEEKLAAMQQEMVDLYHKNTELIESTNRIITAQYYPIISMGNNTSILPKGSSFSGKEAFTAYIDDSFPRMINYSIQDICTKFNALLFEMSNEGNADLIDVHCYDVIKDKNHTSELTAFVSQSGNFLKGTNFYIVYATPFTIDELIKEGVHSILMKFVMKNVIGETFLFDFEILIVEFRDEPQRPYVLCELGSIEKTDAPYDSFYADHSRWQVENET